MWNILTQWTFLTVNKFLNYIWNGKTVWSNSFSRKIPPLKKERAITLIQTLFESFCHLLLVFYALKGNGTWREDDLNWSMNIREPVCGNLTALMDPGLGLCSNSECSFSRVESFYLVFNFVPSFIQKKEKVALRVNWSPSFHNQFHPHNILKARLDGQVTDFLYYDLHLKLIKDLLIERGGQGLRFGVPP